MCPELRGSQSSLVSDVGDELANSKHMYAYRLTEDTQQCLRWFGLTPFTPSREWILLPSCSSLMISVWYRSQLHFWREFIGSPRKKQVGNLVEDDKPYSYTPIFHEMDTASPNYEALM